MQLTKLYRGRTVHKNHSGQHDRASLPNRQKFWKLKVTGFGETTPEENSVPSILLTHASHTLDSILEAA